MKKDVPIIEYGQIKQEVFKVLRAVSKLSPNHLERRKIECQGTR
jgi:hypothetical protein